jgi:hypothetical protein
VREADEVEHEQARQPRALRGPAKAERSDLLADPRRRVAGGPGRGVGCCAPDLPVLEIFVTITVIMRRRYSTRAARGRVLPGDNCRSAPACGEYVPNYATIVASNQVSGYSRDRRLSARSARRVGGT